MSKKLKYKPVKGPVDVQDAMLQSITALETAARWGLEREDAAIMVQVGRGWNEVARSINILQQAEAMQESASELEIAELNSDTERVLNRVGFSPR